MIRRIGCRAHDYGENFIEFLSEMMAEDGYETTQLALKKALADVTDLGDKLNGDYAGYIRRHMSEHDLDISVLGAYLNYAHPDELTQDMNLALLKGHIRIAEAIGARMVGTETGSLDENYKAHPDNHGEAAYIRFRDAIMKVMPLVAVSDTLMAVEAVSHHIIHTPKRMNRLVRDINHPALAVIFDISNLMTPDNLEQQDDIINEMFDLLEDRILVVHAKDFDFADGEKVILPLGQGQLNLDLLMNRVKASGQEIDVLAENVPKDHLISSYIKLNGYRG